MSHAATNWAIQQRGLKPATKLLLWHLADRHNPDRGCFPSQERLAADCEMSRSTVQLHIARLKKAGLVKTINEVDEATKRQLATRYVFAFEAHFGDVLDPETEGGNAETRDRNSVTEAVTENRAEPRPKTGESRDRNSVSNPVREPLREPSAESDGGVPTGPPSPPGGRGAPTAKAVNGTNRAQPGGAAARNTDGGDGEDGCGLESGGGPGREGGQSKKPAIPEGLRHRARDLVAQWVLSGDVERFAAKALRAGLGPETPGIASLTDFHIPGFDFDGPQAADFIARIPATARGGVVSGFDWCERWALGDPGEPKNPEKPFGAVVIAMRKTLAWSARDGGAPAALTPAQRERLDWLREGVARERGADGETGQAEDQQTEDAA